MSDAVTRLNAALEGRYHIEREIGEGGMATVYLAKDLKHNRNVALKVLKPELAAVVGAERFLAEIETTANLQHPHILPLFDSGEADGFLFYVMPYVEGESLRERLDREHQLPVEDAVRIATNVAEALEYAHSHGVVHRDIKPANILLQAGKPVISDFGIALAVGVAGGGRLTETGLSLGTPHYMSPEQATGDQAVGAATDVYALSAVLYEMLVGEPPYTGSTAQAILGKIIQAKAVSATEARHSVPANVDATIKKALEKLSADRFTSAQDFAKALSDPGFRHGDVVVAGVGVDVGPWMRLTIGFAGVAAALAFAFGWALLRPEPPQPVAQFESPFRDGQGPVQFGTNAFNVSPDGSVLVYRGPGEETGSQLWMRRWDDLDASPIRGTEIGTGPAVSPDGQQLAFAQGGEVKVLSFEGGPIRTLGQGNWPRWGPDGYVYFLVGNVTVRVPATGGEPEAVTQVVEGERIAWVSDFLPGGEAALMDIQVGGETEIRALRFDTGEMTPLTPGEWPRYTASGHLTFLAADGTLMAAPFDPREMEITGPSVPMIGGVTQYALSETGDLVYVKGATQGVGADHELVWVTRTGAVTPVGWTFARGGSSYTWRLSPDGTQVALRHQTEGNNDIWVKELPDGPPRRLTFAEGSDQVPWWTPDGQTVTYLSDWNVWSTPADGTGAPALLFDGERGFRYGLWSPDGEWLVLRTLAGIGGASDQPDRDIVGLRVGRDSVPTLLAATADFAENGPALSPDGRWLAYASNETGRYEVWVRPFPDVDSGKWRVSAQGGSMPRWAHNGRELFYRGGVGEFVAAEIDTVSGFRVVESETLFTPPTGLLFGPAEDSYDVALDDQRFLMARRLGSSGDDAAFHYILVQNFFEELKARVPN